MFLKSIFLLSAIAIAVASAASAEPGNRLFVTDGRADVSGVLLEFRYPETWRTIPNALDEEGTPQLITRFDTGLLTLTLSSIPTELPREGLSLEQQRRIFSSPPDPERGHPGSVELDAGGIPVWLHQERHLMEADPDLVFFAPLDPRVRAAGGTVHVATAVTLVENVVVGLQFILQTTETSDEAVDRLEAAYKPAILDVVHSLRIKGRKDDPS
jgi:hypothetical protein